ncbi:MAG: hypothetical protein RQ899_04750 [Pseudomonadales bacterium]|nr:hypothetical protein [Pseudomonadales bacterium]
MKWKVCLGVVFSVNLLLAACSEAPPSAPSGPAGSAPGPVRETPRYPDGSVRFDRLPGEKGYWGKASASALVEDGVTVAMDSRGLLADITDAGKVAPFQPWALGLYKYRQANGLQDDPVKVCISPAGPRHMQVEGGFRIIQDRNYERVYVLFGGGNRNWRVIFMDGRTPPNPEEVTGTYYGYSSGHWEGDTLVVESSGFNDRFWFSNGGLPHTPALKLTERFSRPDHDTLSYEVTIDDPRTYTRPWTSTWTAAWVDGGEIEEHFCEDTR